MPENEIKKITISQIVEIEFGSDVDEKSTTKPKIKTLHVSLTVIFSLIMVLLIRDNENVVPIIQSFIDVIVKII